VTFVSAVDSEFQPRLNGEHSGWQWADPREIVRAARGGSKADRTSARRASGQR
jgi:hypothetical protein